MALRFQEFLAQAQERLIPDATNTQAIKALLDTLVPIIDLTQQSKLIEWSDAAQTLVGANKPRFVLPAVPIDQIHHYHYIGIHETVAGGTVEWQVDVAYPGMTDPQSERFSVETKDMVNMLTIASGTAFFAERACCPLKVYPRGTLTMQRRANGTIGDLTRFQFLREVFGGPGRAERAVDVIVASEV